MRKNAKNGHRVVRYGSKQRNQNIGKITPTFTATCPVRVVSDDSEPVRYSAEHGPRGGSAGRLTADDIAEIVHALEQTAWVQWVKSKMASDTPVGRGGGEIATEAPDPTANEALDGGERRRVFSAEDDELEAAERELEDAKTLFAMYDKPGADRMLYARDAQQLRRYAADRSEAHSEVVQSFERYSEARKGLSDRARKYAEQNGVSYDAALHAMGADLPSYLPTAHAL